MKGTIYMKGGYTAIFSFLIVIFPFVLSFNKLNYLPVLTMLSLLLSRSVIIINNINLRRMYYRIQYNYTSYRKCCQAKRICTMEKKKAAAISPYAPLNISTISLFHVLILIEMRTHTHSLFQWYVPFSLSYSIASIFLANFRAYPCFKHTICQPYLHVGALYVRMTEKLLENGKWHRIFF